jgi:hypothetical protein
MICATHTRPALDPKAKLFDDGPLRLPALAKDLMQHQHAMHFLAAPGGTKPPS